MKCKGPCGKSFEGNIAGIVISRRGWCSQCEIKALPPIDHDAVMKRVDAAMAECKFTFEPPPDGLTSPFNWRPIMEATLEVFADRASDILTRDDSPDGSSEVQ